MPVFLHVGCGQKGKAATTKGFNTDAWDELRVDINPAARPDIVADMTDMSAVASASVDAVFSSHNIEHVYPHQVPTVLGEFRRVLKPDGYAVVTCPDLQVVAAVVAEGRLHEPLYVSRAGPITAMDMIYGHQAALAAGELHMAHRCGFTLQSLFDALIAAGFAKVQASRRRPAAELWAIAARSAIADADLAALAELHFPPWPPTPAPSPPGSA